MKQVECSLCNFLVFELVICEDGISICKDCSEKIKKRSK